MFGLGSPAPADAAKDPFASVHSDQVVVERGLTALDSGEPLVISAPR
ncbi:hypothetical protein [Nocardiopsis gilva]|nr:hypothetical protein [Nocardiopsis gilva]